MAETRICEIVGFEVEAKTAGVCEIVEFGGCEVVVEAVFCEIEAECELEGQTEACEVMKVVAETGICEMVEFEVIKLESKTGVREVIKFVVEKGTVGEVVKSMVETIFGEVAVKSVGEAVNKDMGVVSVVTVDEISEPACLTIVSKVDINCSCSKCVC